MTQTFDTYGRPGPPTQGPARGLPEARIARIDTPVVGRVEVDVNLLLKGWFETFLGPWAMVEEEICDFVNKTNATTLTNSSNS